jgi:hypothetical protein
MHIGWRIWHKRDVLKYRIGKIQDRVYINEVIRDRR